MIDAGRRVQFVDARPRHYVSRTQDIIEGATWRDPEPWRAMGGPVKLNGANN
jgi:Fe-Mn family superoxide dismutase